VKGAPPAVRRASEVFPVMQSQLTYTTEEEAKLELLDDLLESVQTMEDAAETAATLLNDDQDYEEGKVRAYELLAEKLGDRRTRLEQRARNRNESEEPPEGAIRKEACRDAQPSASKAFWCAKWDAIIHWGGSTVRDFQHPNTGIPEDYVTQVAFAVDQLSRRQGDFVYRAKDRRLMDTRELPAANALELVNDHCTPLERVDASADVGHPAGSEPSIKQYRLVDE
jgi:hypothetical protein